MTMLPKIKLNNINKKENYKYNLKKVNLECQNIKEELDE